MYNVLCKLKICKEPLKTLMHNEIRRLDRRVEKARERLSTVENQLSQCFGPHMSSALKDLEKKKAH